MHNITEGIASKTQTDFHSNNTLEVGLLIRLPTAAASVVADHDACQESEFARCQVTMPRSNHHTLMAATWHAELFSCPCSHIKPLLLLLLLCDVAPLM
jgi:hypothetical protein